MILRLEDWKKYPNAIADIKTTNKSFIHISLLYKKMGIKNHAFPLALLDPSLQGVDPRSPDLTDEQRISIAIECSRNIWYFLREVLRLSGPTADGIPFNANRANIAYMWCYFNHVTSLTIQPRQTGKSINNDGIMTWLLCFTFNTTIILFTKSHQLRQTNIERLKEMIGLLPWYLNPISKKDPNNQIEISVTKYNNTLMTLVGQQQTAQANNVGRGNTSENIIIDEIGYIPNVNISAPVLLAAGNAARENAKNAGTNYCTMYTTTPGYLSTPSGKFARKIYEDCAKWTEKYFDIPSMEELHNTIRKNSQDDNTLVLLEFNHRQLGKTDEWLRERIKASQADSRDVIEADYLNIWPSGSSSSPFSKETLEKFNKSERAINYTQICDNSYILNWYVSEEVVNNKFYNRSIVVGMDCSEMIGRDATTLIFVDVNTGEVIGSGLFNKQNLAEFSNFLANLLIKYPNITLVPENKSSFVGILDLLFLLLPRKGVDPFRRIFNRVVQEANINPEYEEVIKIGHSRSMSVYNKYKDKFGFKTAGSGEYSRNILYGQTLSQSAKNLAHLVHDKNLIIELLSIVVKDGRIDHTEGNHDDCVIAWCLATWFLYNGKNKRIYGIDDNKVLTNLKQETDISVEDKINNNIQNMIKMEINHITKLLLICNSDIEKERLLNRLKLLYKDINASFANVLSYDELVKRIELERSINTFKD